MSGRSWRRRLLSAGGGLIALIALGQVAIWYWSTTRLLAGLEAGLAQSRSDGWSVSYQGSVRSGGWPLEATLTLQAVSAEGGETVIPGGLAWLADRVVLRIRLLDPLQLHVDLQGPQSVRLARLPPVAFTAASVELRLPLQRPDGRLTVGFSATAVQSSTQAGLDAQGVWLIAHADGTVTMLPSREASAPALLASVLMRDVRLPPGMAQPLGRSITMATIDAAAHGRLPALPSPRQQAAAWQASRGRVDIQALAVDWGPTGLSGTAQIMLDQALQPAGSGTFRISGYAATLDAMVANGFLSRSGALAANALLSLIASAPDNGGAARVEMPLTLQDRTLSIQRFPLLRIPELVWPEQ